MEEKSLIDSPSIDDNCALSGYSSDKSNSLREQHSSTANVNENNNFSEINLANERSLLLEWNDIKYTIKFHDKQQEILKGVSGFVNPKEVSVMMGASGAGKTTLLNILSGRFKRPKYGKISGMVSVNGKDIKSINYGYHSAYVTQDDILLPSLTVKESLLFSSMLRCPGTKKDHKERVNKILSDLMLEKISENVIGSVTKKGISGGERRRVCIGIELITDPNILILDEPTSGLDSWTAENVFELLLRQAEKGKTVFCTLHQPSTAIFRKVHKLILLSEGYTVYQGLAKNSRKYFADLGFCCPSLVNPSDYFMRLLHIKNRFDWTEKEKAKHDRILQKYDEVKGNIGPDEKYKESTINLMEGEFKIGFYSKFMTLLKRSAINAIRNPLFTRIKFIQAIGMAVILDLIFNNLGHDARSIQNRNGVLFELSLLSITFGSQNSSLAFPSERPIFLKETQQRVYWSGPYYLAKTISEMPSVIIPITIQCLMVYWAIGLNNYNASKFFIFWIGMVLFHMVGTGFGYFVGTIFSTESGAMAGGPLIVIPLVLFGGLFGNLDSMVDAFKWIAYISPFKYGFELLAINEYTDLKLDCQNCEGVPNCVPCDPLDTLGFTDTLWEAFLGLILIGIVVRVLAFFLLLRIELRARI
ncbi:unnamed protein product [Blepharisma stoltei]|uniref:ABC transporter domain-containing protein n=1 Tax=Blepharisma stoltei TaxID=1481888 RepID=A0AAU9JLA7_9CILI|nr:unnamed protein product [Blepharisma stoltei]